MAQNVALTSDVVMGALNAESEIISPRPGMFVAEFRNTGSFSGAVVIERRMPQGANAWVPLTRDGVPVVYTGAFVEMLVEPTEAAQYRMRVSVYTSGSGTGNFQQ